MDKQTVRRSDIRRSFPVGVLAVEGHWEEDDAQKWETVNRTPGWDFPRVVDEMFAAGFSRVSLVAQWDMLTLGLIYLG